MHISSAKRQSPDIKSETPNDTSNILLVFFRFTFARKRTSTTTKKMTSIGFKISKIHASKLSVFERLLNIATKSKRKQIIANTIKTNEIIPFSNSMLKVILLEGPFFSVVR